MLEPRNYKFKKIHKPIARLESFDYKNIFPVIGIYGLKSIESGRISVKELESAKKVLQKKLKRYGKIFVNIFPHYQITSKPQEVRMGKGKGDVEGWICLVRQGSVLFEISVNNIPERVLKDIFRLVGEKISLRTMYVKSIV